MKKYSVIFLGIITIMLSACTKTNEEKAQELVQNYLQNVLTHPESYKSGQIRLDSAYINFSAFAKTNNSFQRIKQLTKKIKKYNRDLKSAESSMDMYSPSNSFGLYTNHDRKKYNQAKKEYDLAKKLHDKIYNEFESVYSEFKENGKEIQTTDFTGWIVEHHYTSLNNPGTTTIPGTVVFTCDKEFTQLTPYDISNLEDLYQFAEEMSVAETQEEIEKVIDDMYLF